MSDRGGGLLLAVSMRDLAEDSASPVPAELRLHVSRRWSWVDAFFAAIGRLRALPLLA